MANNRFQTLSFNQVEKLDAVISEQRFIHSRNRTLLPTTLEFSLRHFIVLLRDRICKYGIHIEEIRLNGGAAGYILSDETVPTFNDLDIIFKLTLAGEAEFEIIRVAVLECLREYLPMETDPARVNDNSLGVAYVDKMIKIWNDRDRWSLISLGLRPNNVELKFVCQMVREYQFSVDSFQIMLDPLLTFYSISSRSISEHFFPTIVTESVYGSFSEAYSHLRNKLIATCSPENIRGGGLLRYCDLLVKGYVPVDEQNFFKKEQYMCTRFFIDFMDVGEQARQISGYLQNHFVPTDLRKCEYLRLLEAVIERSAVCLMNQERQYALDVIARLAQYEMALREAIIPFAPAAYLPIAPHYAGYFYQQPQPQQTGSNSNSQGRDYHNGNKKSHNNHPPRAHNHRHIQQSIQRPNNIIYCPAPPAFVQCRCQHCLGIFSPEGNENSNQRIHHAVHCVPVWISPRYPPSPLVVIPCGSSIAMSSPSGTFSSASSSMGSTGFGTRATPSPLTTPGGCSSAIISGSDDGGDEIEELNGELINREINNESDNEAGDDELLENADPHVFAKPVGNTAMIYHHHHAYQHENDSGVETAST